MPAALAFSLLAVGLLLALGAISLIRSQGRAERRAALFDLLARAARHGKSLDTIVHRYALEQRGSLRRALRRMSSQLDGGARLSEALVAAGPAVFPHPWPQRVAAVEETDAFSPYLETMAAQAARQRRSADQLLLVLTYPAVLCVGFLLMQPVLARLFAAHGDSLFMPVGLDLPAVALLGGAALIVLFLWRYGGHIRRLLSRGPWNTRGERGELLALAACLVDAGIPLHELAERMTGTARTRSNRRRLAQAARAARSGAGPAVVLAPLAPAGPLRARLGNGLGSRLAMQLHEVADRLLARSARRERAWIASVQPIALLAFGVVVFVVYQAVTGFWLDAVDETRLGGDWPW